jgi:hypothetical protein
MLSRYKKCQSKGKRGLTRVASKCLIFFFLVSHIDNQIILEVIIYDVLVYLREIRICEHYHLCVMW